MASFFGKILKKTWENIHYILITQSDEEFGRFKTRVFVIAIGGIIVFIALRILVTQLLWGDEIYANRLYETEREISRFISSENDFLFLLALEQACKEHTGEEVATILKNNFYWASAQMQPRVSALFLWGGGCITPDTAIARKFTYHTLVANIRNFGKAMNAMKFDDPVLDDSKNRTFPRPYTHEEIVERLFMYWPSKNAILARHNRHRYFSLHDHPINMLKQNDYDALPPDYLVTAQWVASKFLGSKDTLVDAARQIRTGKFDLDNAEDISLEWLEFTYREHRSTSVRKLYLDWLPENTKPGTFMNSDILDLTD